MSELKTEHHEWDRKLSRKAELAIDLCPYIALGSFIVAVIYALFVIAGRADGATLNVSGGGMIVVQSSVVYDSVVGLIPPYSALPAGTSIVCNGPTPAIIRYASDQGYAFKSVSANQTFKGLRFDRGGLYLEGAGCNGYTIDNCEFAVSVTTGQKRCGLELSGASSNGRITNNLGAGTNGSFNIYSHDSGTNVVIANNEFRDTRGGIHWGTDGSLTNFLVEQNYCIGIQAQAIEIQAKQASTGVVIQDNYVEASKLSTNPAANADAYSYSIPMEGGRGVIVRRNVSIQPLKKDSPDKIGVRIIFELGGQNFSATDNLSRGGNDAIAVNGAGATGNVTRNAVSGFDHLTGNNGANGAHAVFGFNGPNVVTLGVNGQPIDLEARGRPVRNRRFGDVPPPVPPTTTNPSEIDALRAQLQAVTTERDVKADLLQRIKGMIP